MTYSIIFKENINDNLFIFKIIPTIIYIKNNKLTKVTFNDITL